MGRGIVHPVDEMDSQHLPSHPELLDWMGRDFQQHGYDVKRLVRCIVLSQPYQLSSRVPTNAPGPSTFSYALEKPLSAEVFVRSLRIALQVEDSHTKGIEAEFRKLFPDVVPDDKPSNLKQSLLLSNLPVLQTLMRTGAKRISTDGNASATVYEVFDRVFGRPPANDELAALVEFQRCRRDRPEDAMSHVLWAMITSAEFRFNH